MSSPEVAVDPATLTSVLERAASAAAPMRESALRDRATWLDAAADSLDADADRLVDTAMAETHLPEPRLRGELHRTTFQLRLFADVVRDGGFLDVRIDTADPTWGMGPRPDLRRMKVALGPVLVYAASNFPFAFSVAGGDCASALAAGCPVIVKTHEAHPELSEKTADVVADALASAGAPDGAFTTIADRAAGVAALRDPRVTAAGFTGSIPAGRTLYNIACARDSPIPFYGELGSVNPTVITRAALREDDADDIVTGFIASMTAGVGQFCTKPGVVFVPVDSAFENKVRETALPELGPMLSDRIANAFRQGAATMAERAGVDVIAGGRGPIDPVVLSTTIDRVTADRDALLQECFGPSSLLVRYESLEQVITELEQIDGQLTASVFGAESEDMTRLITVMSRRAGRILWRDWPTGVSVTHAQQHGGPYPATTMDTSTSVGTAAIERWLRPVAYQSMPHHLLPVALRDDNPWGIPQTRR